MAMEWKKWKSATQWRRLSPGIYRVRWPGNKQRTHRHLKDDPLRVIAIGKADHLPARRVKFENAVRDGRTRHSEGRMLHWILEHWGIDAERVISNLQWEYQQCSKAQTTRREAAAIKEYILKHGQLPPLNRQIPGGVDNLGEYVAKKKRK